jgi:phosphatidylinositol 4-kinase
MESELMADLSTHALSREARFSFLHFGFETLKSSHLDAYCENSLRECIYKVAFSWFSVRPQCVSHTLLPFTKD